MLRRVKAALIWLGILAGPEPEAPPDPQSGRRHLAILGLTVLIFGVGFTLVWLVLRLAGVDLDFSLLVIVVGVLAGLSWADWHRPGARRARSRAGSRRRTG